MDPCQQVQVGRGAHEPRHAGLGWDGVVANAGLQDRGCIQPLTCSPEGLWLHVSSSSFLLAIFLPPRLQWHPPYLTPGLVQMPPDPRCLPTFPPTRPSCMGIL